MEMTESLWGSDVIAQALVELELPWLCMVPGATYRGLHDSLVNHVGQGGPGLIMCLHEEHAVSIAHGYAKVTDRPLGVLLHSNVGLMHGSMPLFNMWCDRLPVVAIGATGPMDAERRRPWIDWIHTSIDQGALVRGFTKWDDMPGSPGAAVEALRRGHMIATERPCGPVYVNLDSQIQEARLTAPPVLAPVAGFGPAEPAAPGAAALEKVRALIAGASRPAILCGRASRDVAAWAQRVALAEAMGAAVYGEYNGATSFPRSNPLYAGTLKFGLGRDLPEALAGADLVISLDWTDLGGTVEQLWGRTGPRPPIVSVSNDQALHRGWNMDYQRLAPADLRLAVTPEAFVTALMAGGLPGRPARGALPRPPLPAPATDGPLRLPDLAHAFRAATEGVAITLVSNPLGWPVAAVKADHPLDFLGGNGGGGLGAGPGIAIGAALALRDLHPERCAVAILGDGDTLMGLNALWSAAKHRIPVLFIVANNRSYYNDEVHQMQIARTRAREVGNAWIGTRIDDPAPDIAAAARAQGVEAIGPVIDRAGLDAALQAGLQALQQGRPFLIDVIVPAEYF